MFSQDRCVDDCWFSRSQPLLAGVPAPKFAIGQNVIGDFQPEWSDRPLRDEGVVVGLVWNHPAFGTDVWVYWVKWLVMNSAPHLPLPHCEEVREEDLSAI